MAKLNITFVDELGSNLNRYKAIDVNTGDEYLFDLSRNGTITTQGTPLNAENMNLIVQAINNIELSYIKSITQDENGKIIITKQDDTILDLNIANVVEQSVQCNHRYEITGNTGDEHGLAISDQQMLLDRVQGRTLVKNQLINKANLPQTQTLNGITFTNNGDGSFIINGTATSSFSLIIKNFSTSLNRHKIIMFGCPSGGGADKYRLYIEYKTPSVDYINDFGNGAIKTLPSSTTSCYYQFRIIEGVTVSNLKFAPQLIDLTLKYGAGKEPTTLEQVLNDMQGYEEYDLGSFVHSKNNLISTGRNLVDGGSQNATTNGVTISYSNGEAILNGTSSTQTYKGIKIFSKTLTGEYTFAVVQSSAISRVTIYRNGNAHFYYASTDKPYYTYTFNNELVEVYIGWSNTQSSFNSAKVQVMINYGSTNFPYEPYQEDVMVVDRELKEFEYIDNITNEKVNKGAFVDLGTLTYSAGTDSNGVQHYKLSGFPSNFKGTRNAISTRYIVLQQTTAGQNMPDLSLEIRSANEVYLRDLAYTTVEALKSALSGVILYYETTTETREPLQLPRGMAVWGNGMQIQKGTIPYLLTKTYSLSIGAQVKANIQIDKEQQDQINTLKTEHKELREDFDNTFSSQNVKRETSALIDYPSKELSYPNQQVTVDEIRGRSLNVNQLAKKWVNWSISLATKTDNSFVAKGQYGGPYVTTTKFIANRKYYIYARIKLTTATNAIYFGIGNPSRITPSNIITAKSTTEWQTLTKIVTYTKTGNESQNDKVFLLDSRSSDWDAITIEDSVMVVDLTQMYGAGNEPTDVNQVLIDIDKFKVDGYLPYNLGEIKDCGFSGVKSVEVNIWNEKWELGAINYDTGADEYETRVIRSKGYTKVTPNTTYHFRCDRSNRGYFKVRFYDINKNYLGGGNPSETTFTFTSPTNACYMRFTMSDTYGNTYNNDICINVSNNAINGQYFPYEEDTYEIPKVDLRSAENVYNSLYPSKGKFVNRVGVVEDLSTLGWLYNSNVQAFYTSIANGKYGSDNAFMTKYSKVDVSGVYTIDKSFSFGSNFVGGGVCSFVVRDEDYTDVATFKQSLKGVKLYYELVTPIESDITCPNNYKAWQFGTEMQLGNFPTTIVKDYSISILDQITKNVEVDRNQSDLIEKLLENDKNVDTRISQNENKTNELDDSLENLKNQVEGFVGQNFDKTKLKIEQNLINTRLVYDNEIISSIQNLDVKYIPQIVFSVYQDTEYSAIEKANITNSTDMDMYVSIKGQKDHLNIFVPYGESVETSQSFSFDNLEDYTADIEIKIYYNPTNVSNAVTGYTVFENVKTINLRATVYTTDK